MTLADWMYNDIWKWKIKVLRYQQHGRCSLKPKMSRVIHFISKCRWSFALFLIFIHPGHPSILRTVLISSNDTSCKLSLASVLEIQKRQTQSTLRKSPIQEDRFHSRSCVSHQRLHRWFWKPSQYFIEKNTEIAVFQTMSWECNRGFSISTPHLAWHTSFPLY